MTTQCLDQDHASRRWRSHSPARHQQNPANNRSADPITCVEVRIIWIAVWDGVNPAVSARRRIISFTACPVIARSRIARWRAPTGTTPAPDRRVRVIAHAVDILVLMNPSRTAEDATERLTDRAARLRLPVTEVAAELIAEHTPGLPRAPRSSPDIG